MVSPSTQPTVAIRVYRPNVRDGTREKDLSIYQSAQFTRERNAVGSFRVSIPLLEANIDLLEDIGHGWMFEFWSEAATPHFLFGGYATGLKWTMQEAKAILEVSGPSYLGWLNQRRLLGGTGSMPWAATLGGLETISYKPPVNRIMHHAVTHNPYGLAPPLSDREHPMFRIPDVDPITHISDVYSDPVLLVYGIPRPTDTEITAFMSGTETLEYLSGLVGARLNDDPTSQWYGMPRVSYDIIRYDGPAVGPWPSNALYLVFRVPGMGANRSVGNQLNDPIIFDVAAGGVSSAEYTEDSSQLRNFIWTLAVGEKASRSRYEFKDEQSIMDRGRMEDVVDAGQEGNLNVINQKGTEHLNDKKDVKVAAKFDVEAVPGQVFGYDFFFDDVITVYWYEIGLVLNEFVTSVTLQLGGAEGGGSGGIRNASIVVGSEQLARDSSRLGRYLGGLKRGFRDLRI